MRIEFHILFMAMGILPMLLGIPFFFVSDSMSRRGRLESCVLVNRIFHHVLCVYISASLAVFLYAVFGEQHISLQGGIGEEPGWRHVQHMYSTFLAPPAAIIGAGMYAALSYYGRRLGNGDAYLRARVLDWKCGMLLGLNASLCLLYSIPVLRAEEAVGMRMYFLLN